MQACAIEPEGRYFRTSNRVFDPERWSKGTKTLGTRVVMTLIENIDNIFPWLINNLRAVVQRVNDLKNCQAVRMLRQVKKTKTILSTNSLWP